MSIAGQLSITRLASVPRSPALLQAAFQTLPQTLPDVLMLDATEPAGSTPNHADQWLREQGPPMAYVLKVPP